MGQYKQEKWTLEGLLEGNEKGAERAIALIDEIAARIEAVRQELRPDISGARLMEIVREVEAFVEAARRLEGYAGLWFTEDTQNQQALAFMGRAEQAVAEARNRILFFDLWWRALDEKNAERLMAEAGELRYYLHRQRQFSKHTLSEPEEKVISIKDLNGASALDSLYDIITNRYKFNLEVEGERKELTRDALMAYVRDASGEVRESAYREQFRLYAGDAPVLGQIYINKARDWANENLKMRSFKSPISARNLANDLPDEVVETLLGVCESEAHVFRGYFDWKARELGSKKLRRFDLYAPVSKTTEAKIEFAEGVEMVLEAFGKFDSRFRDGALELINARHMDSQIRQGKRGGAFCYSVLPKMLPWVLLNYTGEPREVATMAHELGHAMHSILARDKSALTFDPVLPLAETASVFSEMLLMDHLLGAIDDPAVKRDMIASKVDDMYATVLRQAYFVIFERKAHEMIVSGATTDELGKDYLDTLTRQFGDSVEVDEVFMHEWISIPHIYHVPFYCYAYSFGMLLSLALYDRYKQEGAGFAPVFVRLLSHGGSMSPADILAEAGVDMRDAEFWRGGFRVIEQMVGRL